MLKLRAKLLVFALALLQSSPSYSDLALPLAYLHFYVRIIIKY